MSEQTHRPTYQHVRSVASLRQLRSPKNASAVLITTENYYDLSSAWLVVFDESASQSRPEVGSEEPSRNRHNEQQKQRQEATGTPA